MKLGLNILGNGAYDEPHLLAWLRRALPPAVVVMNNGNLCGRLASEFPEMMVIARHWPDDNACAMVTPAERWRVLTAYVPSLPNVWLYSQNEPEATERSAAWECALLNLADNAGRRVVVGNYGMGGPEDTEWRGALRPLLARLAGGAHLLGLHEYFDFHNWRAPGYDPLAGDNWLIGRFGRMLAACDELGIPRPRVVITEHGSDSLTDIHHGWRAGARLSELDYAAQLIGMDAQVYTPAPEVVGTCVFCWDGGTSWSTFNVREADGLLDHLARYAEEERAMDMVTMTVTVLQAVRQRSSPGVTGEVLGTWAVGGYELAVSIEETIKDGYCWRYFVDGDGGAWWSATGPDADPQQWVALAVVEPPAPEPEPEPEPTPDPMTPERWLTLLQAWDDCMAAIERAVVELRGTLQETMDAIAAAQQEAA